MVCMCLSRFTFLFDDLEDRNHPAGLSDVGLSASKLNCAPKRPEYDDPVAVESLFFFGTTVLVLMLIGGVPLGYPSRLRADCMQDTNYFFVYAMRRFEGEQTLQETLAEQKRVAGG